MTDDAEPLIGRHTDRRPACQWCRRPATAGRCGRAPQSAGVAGSLSEGESAQLFDTWAIHSAAQVSIQRSRTGYTHRSATAQDPARLWPDVPVVLPQRSPLMADYYRAIGFTEIVVYAPKPQQRAVFDKVLTRLDDLKSDRAAGPFPRKFRLGRLHLHCLQR
jgi:hypothetical protein